MQSPSDLGDSGTLRERLDVHAERRLCECDGDQVPTMRLRRSADPCGKQSTQREMRHQVTHPVGKPYEGSGPLTLGLIEYPKVEVRDVDTADVRDPHVHGMSSQPPTVNFVHRLIDSCPDDDQRPLPYEAIVMAALLCDHHAFLTRLYLDQYDQLSDAIIQLTAYIEEMAPLSARCSACWTRSRG